MGRKQEVHVTRYEVRSTRYKVTSRNYYVHFGKCRVWVKGRRLVGITKGSCMTHQDQFSMT